MFGMFDFTIFARMTPVQIAAWTLMRLLWVVEIIIVINALLSWVARRSQVHLFFERLASPILAPCRKLAYKFMSPRFQLDVSPVIAIVVLELVSSIVRMIFRV